MTAEAAPRGFSHRGVRAGPLLPVLLLLAGTSCGESPVAPAPGAAPGPAPVLGRAPRPAAASGNGGGGNWVLVGLEWLSAPGRAPGAGPALRSTLEAARAHDPPASTVRRFLPAETRIRDVGPLGYRFFVEEGDCGGGSPRLQLGIDTDGDGAFDGNAFGYGGPPPHFAGCAAGVWLEEDARDGAPRWDAVQLLGSGGYGLTWEELAAAVEGAFPSHQVLWVLWVNDSFWIPRTLVLWLDDLRVGSAVLSEPGDLHRAEP